MIKIITQSYFWHAFQSEAGSFNGVTLAPGEAEGDQYTETIASPIHQDASAVGKTYSFNWKVEGNKLGQTGRINSDRYKDYEIREVSSRLE